MMLSAKQQNTLQRLQKNYLIDLLVVLLLVIITYLFPVLSGTLLGLDGIWWALSVTSIVKGIIFVCTFYRITRENR